MDRFAKWLSVNIPLLHPKNAGFNIPKIHARKQSEFYYSPKNSYLPEISFYSKTDSAME